MSTQLNLRAVRPFGDVLGVVFEFIQLNYRTLLQSVVFIIGPVSLLRSFLTTGFTSVFDEYDPYAAGSGLSTMSILIPLLVVTLTLSAFTYVLANAVVHVFVRDGRPAGVREVWLVMREHFVMVGITTLGVAVITALGLVVLLVPGIWIGTVLSLMLIVRIEEDLDFGQAMSRCFELVKGHWWSTFGLLLITGIIAYMISIACSIGPVLVLSLLRDLDLPSTLGRITEILIMLVTELISVAGYSIVLIAAAVQYYNLVERVEGVGLMERIDHIGGPV